MPRPAPPPDQTSNRAQPHHPSAAPELTNSVSQHRKLSWPWEFAQTTALFLVPKLYCLSLHHTLLCSHCRNIVTSTQLCPQMIKIVQSRTEFKHPSSVHPKYLYTQPCWLLAQSFTTFARFTYNGWSQQLYTRAWSWTQEKLKVNVLC